MSKLPRVTGKECIKALSKAGFSFKRQEGSHIILTIMKSGGMVPCAS